MRSFTERTLNQLQAGRLRRKLVPGNHPILKHVQPEVTLPEGRLIASDLIAVADAWAEGSRKAVGLAAPQIGRAGRVFVMRTGNNENWETVINPVIVRSEGKMKTAKEGCLSYPEKGDVPIERVDKIKVVYLDGNGREQRRFMRGFEARVFQHELDHLNGICLVGDYGG